MSFALSPCSLAHGDTGDGVDQFAEHHLVERWAITVLGQDAFQAGIRRLDRGHRHVDQLADARLLGVGLKVRPARLLRPPRTTFSCGILGQQRGPLNVHHSNYVRHVGLVLAVTKATK